MTAQAGTPPGGIIRAQLPASPTAPRQARATVRHALSAWGLGALSGDAELLASELVANAAEHGGGQSIDLLLLARTTPSGQHGIVCQISDTSPHLPTTQAARPDSERGRGLAIVAALATTSGITTGPNGKTAWFTLSPPCPARQAEAEAEPGA